MVTNEEKLKLQLFHQDHRLCNLIYNPLELLLGQLPINNLIVNPSNQMTQLFPLFKLDKQWNLENKTQFLLTTLHQTINHLAKKTVSQTFKKETKFTTKTASSKIETNRTDKTLCLSETNRTDWIPCSK